MKTIRTFIAIPLPAEVKNYLSDLNHVLATQVPEHTVRWVKPQLMHITLRFLGDTATVLLPSLSDTLDKIAAKRDAFTLNLDRLGCFPNHKQPRVIWVGLTGQLDAVRVLKREIDRALAPLGWEQENRAFRPHLTLGRVKDTHKLRDIRWETDVESLTIPVKAIHLIESELLPTGPIYTVRHRTVLEP